jgi:hypothetical protein
LLGNPLRVVALRRGASEPRLSLVLPPRSGGPGAGSLDLLQEPPWPFPRQRPAAPPIRDNCGAVHRRGPGQRSTLCGGCQPDPSVGRALRSNVPRGSADANKQNSTAKEDWNPSTIDPDDAPRAVREYLEVLDDAAFGAATSVEPKFTSHSDPSSQWTAARNGPAFFAG